MIVFKIGGVFERDIGRLIVGALRERSLHAE